MEFGYNPSNFENEEENDTENKPQSDNNEININKEIKDFQNLNLNEKNGNKDLDENIDLINIEDEKNKNNEIYGDDEENQNKINLELDQENDEEDDDEENQDDNKLNYYLFKYNKEYTDNDNDLHSRRITVKDNNEEYLQEQEEKNEEGKDVLGEYKNDEDENNEQEEEENLFPFKIVGDGQKKGETFGKFHSRYFEIDSVKGLFKRFQSSKLYPKNPKEIIEIKNFKEIKKRKVTPEYNDIEITYLSTNKKGKKTERSEYFRFRHQQCRNKWFDSLITLWKCYVNGTPLPKMTKNVLSFIDDRLGIIQEIGRGNKQTKNKSGKKKFKIDLNKFKVLSLLGVGGFGTVFKVRHILTGKIYAMKVMNKNYIIQKKYLHYVVSEFQIMKLIAGFPFVLDLHYCFQSPNYLYLIIDYCPNGDFTKLESMNNLKLFFAEVILAFEYIHNKGVIYRDLKPENILLDESGHIKLCDFNLAKSGMNKNKRANSFCGSPLYFSPEMVMQKGSTYKSDIYGIGLLMYEMVTGKYAYFATSVKVLYDKIKKNAINFNDPMLQGDIKDLIMRMLAKEPENRIDIEDIKKHKYFADIDFDKVLNKEYGSIITVKKAKDKKKEKKKNVEEMDQKKKEEIEYKKFMEQQKKLDEDKSLTVLSGKITLKEMKLDQMKPMKSKVREFYFVKKEDLDQTQEFQLEINGKVENTETNENKVDISSLIMDQYDA